MTSDSDNRSLIRLASEVCRLSLPRLAPHGWIGRLGYLFSRRLRNANPLYAALCRLQHFKSQSVDFDDLSGRRDVTCEFGNESPNRGCLPIPPPHAEQLLQPVHIDPARHNEGVILFANYVASFIFVAKFAYDLLDEVLDGDQPCNIAVFIDDDGHSHVL